MLTFITFKITYIFNKQVRYDNFIQLRHMKKSSIFPQQVSKLVKAQMELYSQPSFEAFNQLLIQYIQGEGPECIQKLQLFFFKQYIEVIDKFFINQQLYCLKELPCHPEPKDNICYTCRVCRKESNAIMCHPCFLKSDHSGHSDEVIQRNYEKGSSCDCGDDTKWNPDGFCSSHKWHPDMSDISEECYKVKQDYRIKTSYFLKILFVLYQLLLEVKKNEKIGIQAVLEQKLDGFGNKLLEKLLQCNKNRRKIIKQTQIILMHKINLKKCPTQSQNITLLDCLMSFTELKQKTISNCVDLIVLPFYRNQPFRQMVTLKYFERYSQYSLTYYQIRFSSILFANSLLISKLTQKKILKKFIFKKKVSDVVRGDLRQKIYFVIYSHIQYFVDSVFFTDLQPNCAVNYWNHFNNLGGFAEIANYCQSFQTQEQLLIVNNQFYHIEYSFLIKIIKTFELMFNMNQIGFFKQVIFELFQKITSKSEQKKSQSNLFFSYERIWTIAVYLFLIKNKQSTFLHDYTQDNKKIEKQQMKSLYHTLKFKSLRQAHQKFKLLFEKLLDYIQKIDKIQLSHENKPYSKFIVYYYGSNNLLASLDTILFQIIIKMMNYISEIDKENNKAKKQQPNNSLPKKKTYINTIDHTISRRVLEMGQQILKEIGKVAQNDNKMKKMAQKKDEPYLPQREQYLQEISLKIQIFWSFIMRLSQSIYSDIPDLHLSTYFSKMRSRNQYKSKYQSYYINLLASINGESISIKDFHYFAKIFFFQQASSFQQFLRDFQDKNNKWISKKIVNKMNIMPVDIFAHMGTLKRKMQLKIIQKRLISNIVLKPPFLYKTKNQPYHLSFSLVNNYAMMIVKDLLKKNLIQTQWLTILCCKLIKQVWKISQYCDSLLATKYLYQLYYHEKINGQLQSNNYLNNNTQKYIDFFPDELIQYLSQLPLNTMDREFLLDQTIKQEQSHEDFYKNQQQEQQQFLQQENQYQHLEQLNSSLQKRINNAMNNSQYNSNSLKPYIGQKEKHCSICKMIDLKVQKLCYVSYTYVPRIFDLKPQSRYISFSSCEHFFHKQCIQKHQKMSQYKQCPQCNNFYNILLLSEQDLYRPFLGKAEVYIQPFFEKICSVAFDKQQVLKHQIKQFYLQIVKSAIIFFLMASTKDRQQFNQMNIHTYLYLIQILKVYFMPQEKDYNQNYQVQFLLLKNSQYRTLFDYLNKVIWSNILTHKKFDYESYENIPISKQQANLIDALLYCAFKQHFFPSIAEFQQKQTFVSYKLPQKLQQLSHSKLKCSCQENGQIVTMICLLHQHPSKETCCCKNCHKKFIQNHILTHKDQIITIETYTGTIIFYKKHYKKLWTISGGNIYLDMEKEFVIKNNADYQDKLDKRLNDELNKAQYQEILFKFYSQEFFINGKLKPIQFNIDHI